MLRIAGLDTSLTATGIAIITQRVDRTTTAAVTTITSRGRRDDGLTERGDRISDLAEQIDRAVGPAALAVIENPSYGSRGGSPVDRHHLWWSVIDRLHTRGVPVATCHPTTRAKFATGTGRADKAAVAAAMARLWPDLVLGNDNESDALALAHAGAVRLGWQVETLQRHRDALDSIVWPVRLDRAIADRLAVAQ